MALGRIQRGDLHPRAWAVLPIAAAAAALAWPCSCPDHRSSHAANATAAAMTSHAMAMPGQAPSDAADHHAAMRFEVGSTERPLVTRGPRGPLWRASKPSAPGTTKHGTFAEQTVAAELERLRHPDAPDPVALRAAVVTTRQATAQLSTRCQRLINGSRSRLSKRDRKRRLACVRYRREIVQASIEANTPGVAAPAAPIQGPAPTTAPPTPTTPAPTTPDPTTPTTPTKKYAAAGVTATDGADPFQLTRASATANIVNFELDNTDRQFHNLFIAPADASGNITGAPVQVIGLIEGGTRKSADVELAPGRYKLLCTVLGHEPMAVNFTVFAPPAT